jgi:hypothetical protein
MTRCPYCKEAIIEGAIKCKHCHSELKPPEKAHPKPLSGINTFRNGFIVGVLFTLVLVILAYKHFG